MESEPAGYRSDTATARGHLLEIKLKQIGRCCMVLERDVRPSTPQSASVIDRSSYIRLLPG